VLTTTLEPTIGNQYEIGIKVNSSTGDSLLAAYEITKKNIAATNPDDPDFSISIGEVRSRGIELDIIGEITDSWNIMRH